jgi:hypothetical protein
LNFHWIPSILHRFLASAILFYQKLGYWGTVQVTMELDNALGVAMEHPLKSQRLVDNDDLFVPSDRLVWEKTVTLPFLNERARDVVVEIVDAAAWSLGVRYFTEERIRSYLEGHFGK